MRVLDIDLDFFLHRKATHISITNTKRLGKKEYRCWTKKDTVRFLEERCGLSSTNKIPGKVFTHHDEVFYFLKGLQQKNNSELQFSIDHVDAHADLGMGDTSYRFIASDILHRTVSDRSDIQVFNGYEGLSAGNYLAFAIACRWISGLNYINKTEWQNDLPIFLFRNLNPATNVIELKKFHGYQIDQMISSGDFYKKALEIQPLELEPAVPFKKIDYNSFLSDGKYDYIFLTQSPAYTPASADQLIPLIKNYIEEI